MEIEINANDNAIDIRPAQGGSITLRTRDAYQLRVILEEIFNAIEPPDVELIYVDEDTRRTVGAW